MTEDKYQEQCSAVVRLVQSSQYKYRAEEQCVYVCVGYVTVQYAIAIIPNTYQKRQKQKYIKTKQQHQRTSSRVTSCELQNLQYREEKKQEVKSAAATLTHTHQAVHVQSSWPGFNESICTVMIYIINTRQTSDSTFKLLNSIA